ncbi:hypothetical protein LR48_Vigan09g006100 [Vigna angularis]|uniref:Uncharacterized protein n=1 Tax=Phaseolus angularis TaxID=3914 RepID=A0A0L9V928_PHAAN|nr:hypothetical protein LR48_Vigan09g006100 [Vigna angularis]
MSTQGSSFGIDGPHGRSATIYPNHHGDVLAQVVDSPDGLLLITEGEGVGVIQLLTNQPCGQLLHLLHLVCRQYTTNRIQNLTRLALVNTSPNLGQHQVGEGRVATGFDGPLQEDLTTDQRYYGGVARTGDKVYVSGGHAGIPQEAATRSRKHKRREEGGKEPSRWW